MKGFIFLGNCSSDSGSEEMGGSEESTENSTTSSSSSTPRYSHTLGVYGICGRWYKLYTFGLQ